MNKWWRIVTVIVLACIGYVVFQFLSHPSIDVRTGSASEAESRADGFYVGNYVPIRRQVSLKGGSIIRVPNAWIEHAWKREFTPLLLEKKVIASGYYLYIPIRWDRAIGTNRFWPFKFALKLDQQGQQISHYPGIGYDPRLGFTVFLDTLPEAVKFQVQQKTHDRDSWDDAVRVESIEFRR